MKLKLKNNCILSGGGNEVMIMFLIIFIIYLWDQRKNLHVHVVTLSGKDNQKLSKFLRKRFKMSVCWNEFKTKSERKNNCCRCFLESNFVGVHRLFVLIHSKKNNSAKNIKPKGIIYQKALSKIIT